MTNLVEAPAGSGERRAPAAERGPTPAPKARDRTAMTALCRPFARPAAYYVASRSLVLCVTVVFALHHRGARIVQTLATNYDGRWYLEIAQHGYPHQLVNEGDGSRWAFFPAFPIAVRAFAEITRLSLPDAGVVAAFVFGLTSTVAVFLAVREVVGTELANRAVLLYVCLPTAYVLSFAYSEGLFLTVAAGCLFALSRRYWVTAGLCACVAGFSRDAGIVVIAVVLVTAVPAAWRGRSWRPAVGAVLAPVGLVAFMAYGWVMVGTPLAFVKAERFWHGQHFVWFRTPVLALVDALSKGPVGTAFVPEVMAGGALVLGFVGLWWLDQMGKRPGVVTGGGAAIIPRSWWIYTFGVLLVAFSAYYLDSIARYAMVAFPLLAAFAWKLPRRWTPPVAALMLCAQAALLVTVLSNVWHPIIMPLVP
jgi:Mannosyltransferase (PIG-V)